MTEVSAATSTAEARTPTAKLQITCVGGGPAGLTLAILAAQAGHAVTVLERQDPAESFGWGVVFWDNLLVRLDAAEPILARRIRDHAYTWRDQVVVVGDQPEHRIPSHGYSMRRRQLLELLRERAGEVGVRIEDRTFDGDAADLPDADLIIAGDGVNSRMRRRIAHFGTELHRRTNQYLWLGTEQEFDSFTFPFVQTPAGWIWAHAYGFDRGASTFVVETTARTWAGLGFDRLDPETTMRRLEEIFAAFLGGHGLHPQAGTRDRTPWNEFLIVTNRRWYGGKVALLGDAAHTTHFTIGSGTRLAMEDAIALADALAAESSVPAALERYQTVRQAELADVQREAGRSAAWFEQVDRYAGQPVADFARLMDDRRSPVMPLLPVRLYVGLTHLVDRMPGIAGPLRKLVSRILS